MKMSTFRADETNSIGRSALFVTTVPITLEAFLLPFARHFRARGWRIDGLTNGATRHRGIHGSFDTLYDITWNRNILAIADHFDTWTRVRRVVVEGGYDIVHVHTPIAAFVTRYALRSMEKTRRPKVIYTAHGFHFYEGQSFAGHTIFKTIEKAAAPWTDYLVTINDEDYQAALGFRGMRRERVRYIPGIGVDVDAYSRNGVQPQQTAEILSELEIPKGAFKIAMVAEFSPVKRHEHLFKALVHVKDPRVIVILAGDGEAESHLRRRAAELGIEHRLRWAGFRNDIPALLAACDALTLVSSREGMPRSVMEAMSMQLPVIGTRTRGIIDVVGDAGWLVDKHDISALAEAIDAAAADPEACVRIGEQARARIGENFAFTDVLASYERLYEEALSDPG